MTQHLTERTAPVLPHPGGSTAPAPITVNVFSDVICPWCYIGSRRLDEGIALFTADGGQAGPVPVQVRLNPFELNPDMPLAGRDRREYRSAKFGSWAYSQQLDAQVAAAGAQDGLRFRHDLMQRTPNTRAAHRLIWLAQQHDGGQQMAAALFDGYFTRGLDAGDPAVLTELAEQVGLPAATTEQAVRQAIAGTGTAGEQAEAGVEQGIARGRQLRISGVPFYLFGDAYTLPPGAQPAEAIAQVLRVVRQDQHDQQTAHATGTPVTTGSGDATVTATGAEAATDTGGAVGSCDLDGTCR